MVNDTIHLSLDEARTRIDDLAQKTNSSLVLYDNIGNIVYVPSSTMGIIVTSAALPANQNGKSGNVLEEDSPTAKPEQLDRFNRIYTRKVPITFTDQTLLKANWKG